MMKQTLKFLQILPFVLLLAACAGGARLDPWSPARVQPQEADAAPRALSQEIVSPGQRRIVTQQDMTQRPFPNDAASMRFPDPTATPPAPDFQSQIGSIPFERTETRSEIITAPAMPPVKVALLLPLSGQHRSLGQAMLQAAQLALFDMDYDSFELMPRDSKGTAEGGRQAAQAAIRDGAQLIIGPVFSSAVQGAKSVVDQSGVPMLAFSTDWSLAGGNTYIMGFLPFAQVQRVASFAHSRGYQNIGIMAPNNEYGNAVISAFNSYAYNNNRPTASVVRLPSDQNEIANVVRNFTGHDGRVARLQNEIRTLEARTQANPGDREAMAELARLRQRSASAHGTFDAILMPVGGDQASALANTLSFYDLGPNDVKRLGTGLWDDPRLANDSNLREAWFAAPQPDLRHGFERRYHELYGQAAPRLSTLAYDATALAVVLARNSYTQEGRVRFDRAALSNPNGFSGIDGIFRFRPDNTVERGLAVLELRHGGIHVVDPAPTTFQQRSF